MEEFLGLRKQGCEVHAVHAPRIKRGDKFTVHRHHVWPLGEGGPDREDNVIYVCPTGHDAIHELLREWIRNHGEPSWEIRRRYHPKERFFAKLGWERIVRAGL